MVEGLTEVRDSHCDGCCWSVDTIVRASSRGVEDALLSVV